MVRRSYFVLLGICVFIIFVSLDLKNTRIEKLRLAFVLTGTPDQFVRLVRSADNGLIAFRAAMTLSAHRRAERQSALSEIMCIDDDFEVALSIGLVSLEHSRLLLSGLVSIDEFSKKLTHQTNEDEIFVKLPAEFKTRDALNLCETLKIPYLK